MRLFNINSIEIRNKTKVGKGFILFTKQFNSAPYFIIDIPGDTFIIICKCKVINLSQKIDSFYSRLVDRSLYSSIEGIISGTRYLQYLVDEGFPKSLCLRMTLQGSQYRKNLVPINIISKFVSIKQENQSSMDKKLVTYGPGLCVKSSEASSPQIWSSKWSAIVRNISCTGCSSQDLQLKVNYLSIGPALLDPSHNYLDL